MKMLQPFVSGVVSSVVASGMSAIATLGITQNGEVKLCEQMLRRTGCNEQM